MTHAATSPQHSDPHPNNGAHHPSAHHERAREPRSLEDLARLDAAALAELYGHGRPPQLGVLSGVTRGRFLAVPALSSLPIVGNLLSAAVRAIGSAPWMPWRGKTFAPPAESHRTSGRNRLFAFEALPFNAHVENSALDHRPTLLIRYDRPENPWPLNLLVDELREVGRGVHLGPAYVRGPNGPVVLLWWACVKE